jgi:DNA-binding NarL/FixJ family response regulator
MSVTSRKVPQGSSCRRDECPGRAADGASQWVVDNQRSEYQKIRVLLCEEQPLVRVGLQAILLQEPDFDVVGEAGDGYEAVAGARRLLPDVVLISASLPLLNGIDVTRRLAGPHVKSPLPVIILSISEEEDLILNSIKAGARGFLHKDGPVPELVQAIRFVASGVALLSPAATRFLLDWLADRLCDEASSPPPTVHQLSDRERQVLELLGQGNSNSAMAKALFVSEATIRSHVHRILVKLHLRDRVQAVAFVHKYGLVNPFRINSMEQ